jgi:protein TonB
MGLTGKTVVTFRIDHNGDITDIKLSESSGNRSLDQAALNAVQSVEHFPELPVDYPRPSLGVIFSFWYNLRIPRDKGAS